MKQISQKTILNITRGNQKKLALFEIQLLCAEVIGKSREFVITHPEYVLSSSQLSTLQSQIRRRLKGEPIAYILGHKEFYGLAFLVNKHTLIPRPETELVTDLVLDKLRNLLRNKLRNTSIIDIGTGSGNIIISIAHNIQHETHNIKHATKLYGIDISKEALKVARKNAKLHKVNENIKFLQGDLLLPISKSKNYKPEAGNLIITANLPYLSKEIYNSTPRDVKNFEPKSALHSPKSGLAHYERLLKQIQKMLKECYMLHVTCYMEISPEQKPLLLLLVKNFFPKTKIRFHKDLAGKWRICEVYNLHFLQY